MAAPYAASPIDCFRFLWPCSEPARPMIPPVAVRLLPQPDFSLQSLSHGQRIGQRRDATRAMTHVRTDRGGHGRPGPTSPPQCAKSQGLGGGSPILNRDHVPIKKVLTNGRESPPNHSHTGNDSFQRSGKCIRIGFVLPVATDSRNAVCIVLRPQVTTRSRPPSPGIRNADGGPFIVGGVFATTKSDVSGSTPRTLPRPGVREVVRSRIRWGSIWLGMGLARYRGQSFDQGVARYYGLSPRITVTRCA